MERSQGLLDAYRRAIDALTKETSSDRYTSASPDVQMIAAVPEERWRARAAAVRVLDASLG